MTKFVVIENFVTESFQDHLEQVFYDQKMLGPLWSFSTLTSGTRRQVARWQEAISEYRVEESPQLVCVQMGNDQVMHQTWVDIRPLTWFFEQVTNARITAINRVKVNLNPINQSWENKIHPPHSDVGSYVEQKMPNKNKMFSMIYYIKDGDGPTVIFDRTLDDFEHKKLPLSVIGEVIPKKGRAIILPSDLLHAGTNPVTTDCRIVANLVCTFDRTIDLKELM